MSTNLILRNANIDADAVNKANWAALCAAAGADNSAMVAINDDTVTSIALVLSGVVLANGDTLFTYADEEPDEYSQGSHVSSFGPSLLTTQQQDQVRDRLARDENGKAAVKVFDTAIRLGLQVRLTGADAISGSNITGVNWAADDFEFNRCDGNMRAMLTDLGLGDHVTAGRCLQGEVEFDRFAKAVNDNGGFTDCEDRLKQVVACGQRRGATHVYWC